MTERAPRVLLTSTTSSFEARVLEARLRSEGLDPELRGAVEGPYPFTVGGMAEVSVYVPVDEIDDARLVLLAAEVDTAVGVSRAETLVGRRRGADVVLVASVIAVLVIVTLARILSTLT